MNFQNKLKSPKVSVIIPFYSGIEWLSEAVDSVLEQDYQNFEIIIINDGSSEDVSHFLTKYNELIIYKYKENGGAATARNMALQIATGDYIAFLDSDDVWLPSKTSKQIAFMESYNISWSHTGYYNWYPETNKLVKKNNSKEYGNVYLQSFLSLKAPTPSIIIKRKCFLDHPNFIFFEDMKKAQDSALWSRISFYYPLGLINEPLVKIRQRKDNSDLSSSIRFSSKSIIYKKIIKGEYLKVPAYIKLIYFYYYLFEIVLNQLKNIVTSHTFIENVGKIFWTIPFFFERICIYFLKMSRKKYSKYIAKNDEENYL